MTTLSNYDFQILIDTSGSMGSNDPGGFSPGPA